MGEVLAPYPDAESVLRALLTPLARTVTMTDEAETFTAPLIHVQRTGGSDDGITDRPRLEVAVYTANRHTSWQLAEQARQRILAAGGTRVGGVLVDRASTETPAQQVPDINRDVRKVVAVYRLDFRRPRI